MNILFIIILSYGIKSSYINFSKITLLSEKPDTPLTVTSETKKEAKSRKRALFLSLLLPGLGEHYMDSKKDAIRAYIIETGIWSYFFGARWYVGVLAKDCILYAQANAGAKKGLNEDYYDAVEKYKNLEAYNTAVREEARRLYPKNREEQLKYIEENSFPDSLRWEWKDEKELDKYRELRSKKRRILHRTSYCIGIAVLNRIVSAIIATHLPKSKYSLRIEPNGIYLSYSLK
jgi:hypothetical protein